MKQGRSLHRSPESSSRSGSKPRHVAFVGNASRHPSNPEGSHLEQQKQQANPAISLSSAECHRELQSFGAASNPRASVWAARTASQNTSSGFSLERTRTAQDSNAQRASLGGPPARSLERSARPSTSSTSWLSVCFFDHNGWLALAMLIMCASVCPAARSDGTRSLPFAWPGP